MALKGSFCFSVQKICLALLKIMVKLRLNACKMIVILHFLYRAMDISFSFYFQKI